VLKKGGALEKARQFGVRAVRYTVEADSGELAEIATLVALGKVRPHVQKTFPLNAAADALASVKDGHSMGKVVLKVA
jgi:NADPH:quinone reductase-like Zn-dependent oxidoreductase